jgi:hypothetical protein
MKYNDIDKFEKIQAQLKGLYDEIAMLSKKSPNDALNKFKLKFINDVLKEANSILQKKYKPFEQFKNFNEDDLPTNSDVTLILYQYLNCMEKLRADNIVSDDWNQWYWVVASGRTDIRTSPPKKIKEK